MVPPEPTAAIVTPGLREGNLRSTSLEAALLGLAHAAVDAASAWLLFFDLRSFAPETFTSLVLLYNALAFAGQVPLGLLLDRLRTPRAFGALGVALAGLALLVAPLSPVAGVVAIGTGNALFHLGAGAHVLARSESRAAESGIFVGPGAAGLFAGIWLGTAGVACRAVLLALLAGALPLLFRLLPRTSAAVQPPRNPDSPGQGRLATLALATSCLLASVTVRSVVGSVVNASWRGVDPWVMASLALAAFAGKAAGGLVADRLGWIRTSAFALVAGALLLGLGLGSPVGAVAGVLLLQSTLPVTLKATHLLVPDRPGLAFGLPCAALLAGALVALSPITIVSTPTFLLAQLLVSAALVVVGLRFMKVGTLPART